MKKLFIFPIFLLVCFTLLLPISAHTTLVYDKADLLTDPEEAALCTPCNCTDPYDIGYYVLTLDLGQAPPSDSYVLSSCGIDSSADAIVLVIRSGGNRHYYDVHTWGKADRIFSDTDIESLLDTPSVYNAIKGGKLSAGASSFVSLAQNAASTHYKEELERKERAPWMALLCGGIVAVAAAGITVLCIVLTYRKKRHGESYPLDRYATLTLTEKEDIFVGSYVTRVRVQSSSGSRSGGSRSGGHRGGR